jgi:hypothetical protein
MLNLTQRQRQGPELSLRFHSTRPPTVGGMLRLHAPAYILILAFCVTVSVGMSVIGVPIAGAFCLGMLVGAALRILRSTVAFVGNGPLTEAMTQWDLVGALVHPPAPVAEAVVPVESQP